MHSKCTHDEHVHTGTYSLSIHTENHEQQSIHGDRQTKLLCNCARHTPTTKPHFQPLSAEPVAADTNSDHKTITPRPLIHRGCTRNPRFFLAHVTTLSTIANTCTSYGNPVTVTLNETRQRLSLRV